MNRNSALFVLALSAVSFAGQGEGSLIKRSAMPALSPDGSVLVFSWQGDIWRASSNGGRAERLTVHSAADTWPRFTPDGSRIVFASTRMGSADIWSMTPQGTDLKRHTFDSGSEVPSMVHGGYVYGHTNAWSRTDLFKVKLSGGDLIRLTNHSLETAYNPSVSPDGSKVIYNRGSYGAASWRKPGVLSSAVGDIWVADNTVPLSNHKNTTKSVANELMPTQVGNGELLYQSNVSGWPNLYLGKKKLTNHVDGTVRNPQLSANGQVATYEFNSEIWTYNLKSGENKKLALYVPEDQRNNPVAELTLATGLSEFAIAPDGKRTALVLRGEIFMIPERGGTTRRMINSIGWDGHVTWLNPKTMLYVAANADGKRVMKTVDVEGVVKPFLSDARDVFHPSLSPDGKMVAFHRGDDEICVVPTAGGTAKVILRGDYADAQSGGQMFNWSPDNKWLAIYQPTDRGANIVLKEVDGAREIVVARLSRGGSTPQWLPNGRGVFFTSSEFDATDLYMVDLIPQDVTFTEDDLDKIDSPRAEGAAKKEVAVEVYEPQIDRRMRRLTFSQQGVFSPVASADSRTIYATVDGAFSSVNATGGGVQPVAGITGAATGTTLGPNGKLYFVQSGRLNAWTPGAPGASPVAFSAQMTVNLRDEEMALFNEIGWAMDRLYYDSKMHGKNWPAIRDKFAKVVPYCFDRTDFYGAMGEMMEELDSSHLGATAPPVIDPNATSESTAFLGIDFDPKALDSRNAYVISRVIPGSSASHPSSLLMVGDRLVSIDGVTLNAENPYAKQLNRKSGRKVKLGIERAGKAMEVMIRPDGAGAKGGLLYQEWVDWQRAYIDRISGGKLAYFHIEGMDMPSYELFRREIRTLTPGKKGAVIDVRFNGGGSTSHLILGILIKQPWLIRTTRGEFGVRISENIFRGDSLELPTGLLMNQASYSNAEIMGEGFRTLKRGPIVGERTPGYVIGTGGYGLWDSGFIRMPSIGSYGMKGDNLENDGRKPDIEVPFDPDAWMRGEDPQTDRLVREMLKSGS